MGQRHALRPSRRARGVEHLANLVRPHRQRLERRRWAASSEPLRPRIVETDQWYAGTDHRSLLRIGEAECDGSIVDDVVDRFLRQLRIDGHRDQPRAHDAEVGGQDLRPVQRQDADAGAAREARLRELARDAHGHRVDRAVAVSPRRVRLAQVDDGDAVLVEAAVGQVAEVAPAGLPALHGRRAPSAVAVIPATPPRSIATERQVNRSAYDHGCSEPWLASWHFLLYGHATNALDPTELLACGSRRLEPRVCRAHAQKCGGERVELG